MESGNKMVFPAWTGGFRIAALTPETESEDQSWRISRIRRLAGIPLLIASGAAGSLALPPAACPAALLFLLPLFFLTANRTGWAGARCGWYWGLGWGFCGFHWLAEIQGVIPYLLAPVLALYYGAWGLGNALLYRWILLDRPTRRRGFNATAAVRNFPLSRQMLYCTGTAAWWVVTEWLRSGVLPWNNLAVTLVRQTGLIQCVRWSGTAFLSFGIVFASAALFLTLLSFWPLPERDAAVRKPEYRLLTGSVLLIAILWGSGEWTRRQLRLEYAARERLYPVGMVQGAVPATRTAQSGILERSLTTYLAGSRSLLAAHPAVIVWPETAVPYPLRGGGIFGVRYRQALQEFIRTGKVPLLIGTLEFDLATRPAGQLNSLVLCDGRDVLKEGYAAQYDKVHPVPFGEFVPCRRYLPQWAIDLIDMERDLAEGRSLAPLLLPQGVRAGVSICFEDVFPEISRAETLRGADFLLVVADDAWYPTSSEPQQHLDHAVFRAIETGLPLVRCGNDCATCVIAPNGEIAWDVQGNPGTIRRGAAAGIAPVRLPASGKPATTTFYTRHGEWGPVLCIGIAVLIAMGIFYQWYDDRRALIGANRSQKGGRAVQKD